MKINLDTELCQGHGRCYEIAPSVFEDDDWGHAVLRLDVVDGADAELVKQAVLACPERAISVTE